VFLLQVCTSDLPTCYVKLLFAIIIFNRLSGLGDRAPATDAGKVGSNPGHTEDFKNSTCGLFNLVLDNEWVQGEASHAVLLACLGF